MPTKTSIEWTDYSSNPIKFRTADGRSVWACEKESPGCKNRYAESLSKRYTNRRAGDWNADTMAGLTCYLDDKELRALLTSKAISGQRVFVGDMTDVFGEWVPDEFLDRLFAVFALRPDVTFQVLTKRSKRMRDYINRLDASTKVPGYAEWPELFDAAHRYLTALLGDRRMCELCEAPGWNNSWPMDNLWLGVSAEDQPRADERIPDLLQTPAAVRFLSCEPLIGSVDLEAVLWQTCGDCDPCIGGAGRSSCYQRYPLSILHPDGIHWVIVGGHSARPCDVAWIRSIVEQCQSASVPVFWKQSGGSNRCKHSSKGGCIDCAPADLRVREFPHGS